MEGWEQVSIGEHVDLINGFAFPSAGFTEGEGIPLIRIRDLERQKTDVNFRGKYNNHYIVKKEDLLIGMDGDFLTVKWKGSDALLNQRVCKLVTKNPESLAQDFLFYRIIEEILHIHRITAATTVKHLSSKDVLGIEIDLPPKHEQTKIAEILLTVDRAIEQTEALIAKQQHIKTGLMQDLLTRGIDEHGNLRTEQTHQFKDSPLGRIPVEWQVKPLGQVSNLITNGFVGVATPHYTESSEGIPYLYGNNIRNNYVDLTKVTLINRSFHSKQRKSQLQPGDMLTVQSGHIGTTAVVPDSLSESNCHALIITKFKKEMLSPDFVSFYCNFCLETGSMSHLFIGSTIKHINTSDFAKFAIPFPPKDEQFLIAHRLLDLINMVNVAGAKLTKLRALKTALMQDLLTGKKRVTGLLNDMEVSSL